MFNLRKASLAAMASAALLAGCSSVPVPEEDGMASGASVVTPKQQEYLAAFNAPRGPVRATQTGIRPGYNFVGVAETDLTETLEWQIVAPNGVVVEQGRTIPYGFDSGSGANVQLVVTSGLRTPATNLVLVVEGVGKSHPFDVSEDIFRDLKYDTLRYFYHNRAGVPIESEHAGGEQWARPAGHEKEVLTCFHGKDMYKISWPRCDYTLDVSGGWYDAGDQSKYVVNSGISVWTLLNAYERGTSGFEDGATNIPESGNGLNDLLDEARYNLDYMLAMQAPDGSEAAIVQGNMKGKWQTKAPKMTDVSGMVHHKSGNTEWPSLPMMPHKNTGPRALFAPSTAATLHVAAVGAQCARVFRGVDDAYADKCLAAAKRAYAAAQRIPDAYAYGNFPGTGPYGSTDIRGEFYWAAAEMYVATGETAYADDLKTYQGELDAWPVSGLQEPNWGDTMGLGILSLARAAPDESLRNEAAEGLLQTADAYLTQIRFEGYQIPLNRGVWPWGSVGTLANRGLILGTAYDMTGNVQYRDGALDLLDYILGRNPRDISYISGHGENAFKAPHHRHWAGAQYRGFPLPPPGAVSGGPNNTNPAGPVSRAIIDECQAQTCYADHVDAYELNEVAINWQAATFWLAAWADDIDRAK
tara:strand:- start:623 stop:2545 length:1923 start_codon:yes stop_codon:yes gene_type:complete